MARTYGDPLDDEDLPDASENYRESSDEDFNPTAAAADDSSASEDEAPEKPTQTQRKRKREAEASEGLDSGDEATIEAAQKRRRKAKAKKQKGARHNEDDEDDEDDELMLSDDDGGEGGLIRTRAQRKVEQVEKRPLARIEGATVDVDALWARMLAAPVRPGPVTEAQEKEEAKGRESSTHGAAKAVAPEDEPNLISIRKTYIFAGQRTTEDKQVPRSLLEQHLSDGWKTIEIKADALDTLDTPDADSTGNAKKDASEPGEAQPRVRRPLRRPTRFEPNPTGYVRTLPPEHQLTWPRKLTATAVADQENMPAVDGPKVPRPEKAQKLNVVDKSRLDWTGFVDKEGIAEELKTHGKTKESYLGRMQFLAGVEARREEERRQMKTTATT